MSFRGAIFDLDSSRLRSSGGGTAASKVMIDYRKRSPKGDQHEGTLALVKQKYTEPGNGLYRAYTVFPFEGIEILLFGFVLLR